MYREVVQITMAQMGKMSENTQLPMKVCIKRYEKKVRKN
jgi:hypothetical protein